MTRDIAHAKFLVTGGAGFIGSHTVDALITAGARVVVLDDLSTGRRENLNPQATYHEVNIANERVEGIIKQEHPDVIYHFAHHVLVPKSVEDPMVNVDALVGSLRILRVAREIGTRKIVYSSSGFVYGNPKRLPVDESALLDPVSPYAVSKQATENYLRFYLRAYRLPCVILRYAAVYGPRQVTGAMPDYIRKLSSGQQADIWGDGNKTRDYVHASDVVRANLLALRVPDDHPDPVFNIGTGVETTLNTLYRRIAALLAVEARPIYHPDRPGEQVRYALSNTKAHSELGWRPEYTLDDGLRGLLRPQPSAKQTTIT